MKKKLTFQFDCGPETCASKPGKFCQFLRLSLNGKDSCMFFGRVFDKDGWIQRDKDCILEAK
jgi:hypothetical protein